jgi:hypothetical protein
MPPSTQLIQLDLIIGRILSTRLGQVAAPATTPAYYY